MFNERWGHGTAQYESTRLSSEGKHQNTRHPSCLEKGLLFSWLGEGVECSQGLRRAVGASALGAWELGGAPQDLRGELQEAGGGPQELEGGLQGPGGGLQELVGAPPGLADEQQEPVGAPPGPGDEPQQMEEDGLPELLGAPLGPEGGHQEQVGGPQMLVGGPPVPGGEPQELGGGLLVLEGGPQMLGGGPLVLRGGPQELVGAAGEGPEALREQAHWVAWVAEAGLLAVVGAKTLAVVAEGANHSSGAVGVSSPQEAQQGGSAGLVASPS